MDGKFDILVIGNGLIGSAATRYLGKSSNKIALLGTCEPINWSKHEGVFASHYDEGRITRIIDQNPIIPIFPNEIAQGNKKAISKSKIINKIATK